MQLEHRAVGLVGLDDQPLARPPGSIGKLRIGRAADQPSGVAAGTAQGVHEHRGGRRLAVGARHRNRATQRRQLAQQLRARALGQPAPARG